MIMSVCFMMVKKQASEYESLLPFLEEDISSCLYIYMDLINGEKENADMEVWAQEVGGKLELVLLRYYESFQVYSRSNDPKLYSVVEIMERHRPKMISGQQHIIKQLESMTGKAYQAEYGYVYEINDKTRLRSCGEGIVTLASEVDAAEIAYLIGIDQGLGGHYSREKLEQQIRSRICTGTGRSYVIRANEKIVAHTATYAETEKYAVVSGTIIHPDYRDRGYYPIISSYIVQQLNAEGKQSFTFAVEPRMVEYHGKMDDKKGSYGRLVWLKGHS